MGGPGKPSLATAADKQGVTVVANGNSDPPPADKDHSLYVGAAGLLPDMKTNVERLYAKVDKRRRDESSLGSETSEEGGRVPPFLPPARAREGFSSAVTPRGLT